MADEPSVIRGINWREVFPFTQIFRSFRVAVHPSKLILALAGLLVLYFGGRLLDAIWPASHRAVPGEIASYVEFAEQRDPTTTFSDIRKTAREQTIERYQQMLLEYKVTEDVKKAEEWAKNGDELGKLKENILKAKGERVQTIATESKKDKEELIAASKADIDKAANDEKPKLEAERDKLLNDLQNVYVKETRQAFDTAAAQIRQAEAIKGEGLFITFLEYETAQIDNLVESVFDWNWLGADTAPQPALPAGFTRMPMQVESASSIGVVPALKNLLVVGPGWLLHAHWVFFVLFMVLFLLVWGIFGGAVARIAAVHVARDEKISASQALKFSTSKMFSFVSAPIIPLIIILVIGLLVAAGGLIFGNIPFIGAPLLGLFFFLALAAGFVMALVLIGTIGGFNLMYPTIAVEGSDAFDAISRSFSYVFARPWKMLFYTMVALVYGVVTYLFARVFIYLVLVLTHNFVDMGVFTNAESERPLWTVMWPEPETHEQLSYDIDGTQLRMNQLTGAYLVAFWVYLLIGLLGAFLISFYFSANTFIYYLLRKDVDATELDDVYIEQADEEFTEPAPVPPKPAETPAGSSEPKSEPKSDPPSSPPAEGAAPPA